MTLRKPEVCSNELFDQTFSVHPVNKMAEQYSENSSYPAYLSSECYKLSSEVTSAINRGFFLSSNFKVHLEVKDEKNVEEICAELITESLMRGLSSEALSVLEAGLIAGISVAQSIARDRNVTIRHSLCFEDHMAGSESVNLDESLPMGFFHKDDFNADRAVQNRFPRVILPFSGFGTFWAEPSNCSFHAEDFFNLKEGKGFYEVPCGRVLLMKSGDSSLIHAIPPSDGRLVYLAQPIF